MWCVVCLLYCVSGGPGLVPGPHGMHTLQHAPYGHAITCHQDAGGIPTGCTPCHQDAGGIAAASWGVPWHVGCTMACGVYHGMWRLSVSMAWGCLEGLREDCHGIHALNQRLGSMGNQHGAVAWGTRPMAMPPLSHGRYHREGSFTPVLHAFMPGLHACAACLHHACASNSSCHGFTQEGGWKQETLA